MKRNGYRLVSGGTDNHLMLVDVGAKNLTGKDCQIALDEAGITVNKNTIPFETRSPFQASGVRLGTPAVTTRGMKEAEMAAIADMISEVLLDIKNLEAAHKVRARVPSRTPLAWNGERVSNGMVFVDGDAGLVERDLAILAGQIFRAHVHEHQMIIRAAADEAGITVNKNTIPFETRSPFQASGVRLGTPARTLCAASTFLMSSSTSEIMSAIAAISASFMPRVVTAGAQLDAAGLERRAGLERNRVFVDGDAGGDDARHEGGGNGGDCGHDFRGAAGHQKCRGRAQSPRPRARADG